MSRPARRNSSKGALRWDDFTTWNPTCSTFSAATAAARALPANVNSCWTENFRLKEHLWLHLLAGFARSTAAASAQARAGEWGRRGASRSNLFFTGVPSDVLCTGAIIHAYDGLPR